MRIAQGGVRASERNPGMESALNRMRPGGPRELRHYVAFTRNLSRANDAARKKSAGPPGRRGLPATANPGLHPLSRISAWAIFVSSLRDNAGASLLPFQTSSVLRRHPRRVPQVLSAAAEDLGLHESHLLFFACSACRSSLPMRPCGPTTNGSESAFQLRSASGASCSAASGWIACQLIPSFVEVSVPFGPTVIQVLVAASYATEER